MMDSGLPCDMLGQELFLTASLEDILRRCLSAQLWLELRKPNICSQCSSTRQFTPRSVTSVTSVGTH